MGLNRRSKARSVQHILRCKSCLPEARRTRQAGWPDLVPCWAGEGCQQQVDGVKGSHKVGHLLPCHWLLYVGLCAQKTWHAGQIAHLPAECTRTAAAHDPNRNASHCG